MTNHLNRFILICLIFIFHIPGLAQPNSRQETQVSQIISTLRLQFQKRNSLISYVEINDIRPLNADPIVSLTKPNRYLVMARGIRGDRRFEGKYEDELFGIFLFDDSLFSVLNTIDIMPTRRWGDYAISIVKIWKDTLTIHGEGVGYGDAEFDKMYPLHLKE